MYLVLALLTQESAKTNQKENHECGDEELRNELLKIIQETMNKFSTDQIANIAELFNQDFDLAKEILRRLSGIENVLTSEDVTIEPTTIMKEARQEVEELNK